MTQTVAARMLTACAHIRPELYPCLFLNQIVISNPAPAGLDGTVWEFDDKSVLIVNSGGCFASGVGFIAR